MFETVIVPLDGSAHAEFALPYARDEAFRHGARIVLIHVLPRPGLPPTPIAHGGPAPVCSIWPAAALEREEREERDWLDYLDGVRERYALPENTRTVVGVGDPTCRLLDEARTYPQPLIVMTTGDATGYGRPPLSEVARRALLAGTVPILAVREPAPQTRLLAQVFATPVAGQLRVAS
jgi:nucleotide-binding universal stress UspA family protein